MFKSNFIRVTYPILFIILLVSVSIAQDTKYSGIEGTYKLVSRKLPDGSTVTPPRIEGMLSYSKKYKNFNIMWKGNGGKVSSISSVSSYNLGEFEYSEKNIFYMINDGINGNGVTYDLSGKSGSSPIIRADRQTEFKLPLFDEPDVSFGPEGLTAMKRGQFIDTWEKVE